jgi:hypothetical protein
MTNPNDHVVDLIFGRWRSQTLYTGVELGVFEAVDDRPKHAVEITDELDIDPENGYRLLRALSSLCLLEESKDRRFSITAAGELLREDHPESMRDIVLLEEGPTLYAVWTHLPEVVREGGPTGFQREFGHSTFEHREADPEYAKALNDAMTSYSKMESFMVADLLDHIDFSDFDRICDAGGGYGHLLCTLIQDAPSVEGVVLEVPSVVEDGDQHWHEPMGVTDRVDFVAGDFFEEVPPADAYLLKHVLHDWTDSECVEILSTIREASPDNARLFNCEFVVPGPAQPHLAKLMDIHMMVAVGGLERTEEEYADLFREAGFEHVETHKTEELPMSVVYSRAI